MINKTHTHDIWGMVASLVCAVHCLAVPVLLVWFGMEVGHGSHLIFDLTMLSIGVFLIFKSLLPTIKETGSVPLITLLILGTTLFFGSFFFDATIGHILFGIGGISWASAHAYKLFMSTKLTHSTPTQHTMWQVLEIWVREGIKHILDINAYDHLLYIVALTIPFIPGQVKRLLLQVTAFTLGHTIALYIATHVTLPIEMSLVELCIILSILLTALYGIFRKEKDYRFLHFAITLFVGCIHGLGFGSYFSAFHPDKGSEFIGSLLGFNIGVEVGQLIIVSVTYILTSLLVNVIPQKQIALIVNSCIAIASVYLLVQYLIG